MIILVLIDGYGNEVVGIWHAARASEEKVLNKNMTDDERKW
jgi:hypothetical protein